MLGSIVRPRRFERKRAAKLVLQLPIGLRVEGLWCRRRSSDPVALMKTAGITAGVVAGISIAVIIFGLAGRKV
jgi:hypothetical protein